MASLGATKLRQFSYQHKRTMVLHICRYIVSSAMHISANWFPALQGRWNVA